MGEPTLRNDWPRSDWPVSTAVGDCFDDINEEFSPVWVALSLGSGPGLYEKLS